VARYPAIAAISQSTLTLLKNAAAVTEFKDVVFAPIQAKGFAVPSTDTVTLFLYRVSPSTAHRSLPPRRLADGRVHRPPLPVDLYYLLTPWTSESLTQQRLLAWCIRTLEDMPELLTSLLNASDSSISFAPSETLAFVLDMPSLQDMVNIWDALKSTLQYAPLSVAYIVRSLLLESDERITEGALTQTREFQFGAITQP
jgi:hypothetical protein